MLQCRYTRRPLHSLTHHQDQEHSRLQYVLMISLNKLDHSLQKSLKFSVNVITETSPYFLGNFRKNMLHNCFKKLFFFVEKINVKFHKIKVK